MKDHTIIFPFDSKENLEQKTNIIRELIGKENMSYYNDIDERSIPELEIRCDKKTWKQIKFKLGLCKVYY